MKPPNKNCFCEMNCNELENLEIIQELEVLLTNLYATLVKEIAGKK